MIRALVAALLVATAGCAAHRGSPALPGAGEAWVGTYRAVLDAPGETSRHARLALWAEAPDRLHAELSGPVGGVRLTLDAGDGRACVLDVASGTAYVGGEGADALYALTGVRIGVADAVAALLQGRAPQGTVLERDGAPGALPTQVRIRTGGRTLSLERIRLERTHPGAPLGTGRAPEDAPVRPLSELSGTGGEGA